MAWNRVPPLFLSPLAAVVLTAVAPAVSAHSRGESYSRLAVDGDGVIVSFTMDARQLLTVAPQLARPDVALSEGFGRHVTESYGIWSQGERCRRVGDYETLLVPTTGYLRVDWRVSCGRGFSLEVRNAVLEEEAPGHLHRVRLRLADQSLRERLMMDGSRIWRIDLSSQRAPDPGGPPAFFAYLGLGIEHIVFGLDHLAFLLAVILSASGRRATLWAVTGFTVGHSVTLALAVLGYASPHGPLVEALIGYTIALVAAEVVMVRAGRTRTLAVAVGALWLLVLAVVWRAQALELPHLPRPWALLGMGLFSVCYLLFLAADPESAPRSTGLKTGLTALFGLVHGFGFAGSLRQVGLPEDQLVPALLGFNLGVEVGQVALLLGFFAARSLMVSRLPPVATSEAWSDLWASLLCGLGLFWFVSRLSL